MDTLNLDNNRLRRLMTRAQEGGRTSAEVEKFSVEKNVFVEVTVPTPNYGTYSITQTTPGAELDPNASAPAIARIWDLSGYMGLHGYIDFTGGTIPTVALQLWALDQQNQNWFLVGAATGISEFEEFRFENKVRNRTVFVQISAESGSSTALTIHMSPE